MAKRSKKKNSVWVLVLVILVAIGTYYQKEIREFLYVHVFNT